MTRRSYKQKNFYKSNNNNHQSHQTSFSHYAVPVSVDTKYLDGPLGLCDQPWCTCNSKEKAVSRTYTVNGLFTSSCASYLVQQLFYWRQTKKSMCDIEK